MGVASKYNVENAVYLKLRDLAVMDEDENGRVSRVIYPVAGLYIHDSPYGEHAVAVCDDFNVNLPTHLTKTVKRMIADEEVGKQINAGGLGFIIKPYFKHNQQRYGLKWVDIKGDNDVDRQ